MTSAWRVIFWIEVVICAATVASWIVAPSAFLEGVFGLEGADLRHHLLLLTGADVVLCAYVYLYARLLLAKPFPEQAFRFLQEAMAIGDVVMLVLSGVELAYLEADVRLVAAQAFMAALWLTIRVTWLVRSRTVS